MMDFAAPPLGKVELRKFLRISEIESSMYRDFELLSESLPLRMLPSSLGNFILFVPESDVMEEEDLSQFYH